MPYLSFEAQEKVNLYTSQLVYFSSAKNKSKSVGTKTDIVMASWFPMKVVRTLTKLTYADIGIDYIPSYDGFDIVEWNDAPWR